jgi:hypothetical protein
MGRIVPDFGPGNDHELEIARGVDRACMDGTLGPEGVPDILALLDFVMSESDSRFLVRYLEWRIQHPIPK